MNRLTPAVAIAALALAGCSAEASDTADSNDKSNDGQVSTEIAWNDEHQSFGEDQWSYVVRITNGTDDSATVKLTTKAYDEDDTVVGHNKSSPPTIPAGESLDYYDALGGAAFTGTLNGDADRLKVDAESDDATRLQLDTDVQSLTDGDMNYGDQDYSYDVTTKVTNTTGQDVDDVMQQMILYDADGKVVGGEGPSMSDDFPGELSDGESYTQSWGKIGTAGEADSAKHTVWAE